MHSQRWGRGALFTMAALVAPVFTQGAAAQRGQVVVPANTVVHVELAEKISSRTAFRGERVTARLDENDRSGFPDGTRFEGVVTEVRSATADRPATLDMEFRRAVLPNGTSSRVRADLVSLAKDDLRTTADGRLESRRKGGSFDWKWVGVGAGGGAVLGEIFGDSFLKGALLGGLGGAIYGYLNRDRDRGFREVELESGTEFGLRLDRAVAFNTRPEYRFVRRDAAAQDRVLGAREELGIDSAAVTLDGRAVRFDAARPLRINGMVYVPLQPVAAAAGWTLRHPRGSDSFMLNTSGGEAWGAAGEQTVTRGGRRLNLDAAPMLISGELYVPLEYLSRVGRLRVDWDARGRWLDLRTDLAPQRASRRFGLSEVVRGLADADYTALKTGIGTYQIIDVESLLREDEVARLQTLVSENSGARRNRNLLTDFLRDANRITNRQTVVGLLDRERIIYVL